MKQLSFMEAVLAALLLSVAGAVLAALLTPLLGVALVSRGLCALLALAYVLLLVARSRITVGRASLLALWTLAAVAIAVLCPSLLSTAAAHLTLVWLMRALLLHTRRASALADLVISALSLAAGGWAFVETASVFAGLWTLGLVQAACTLLPARATPRAPRETEHGFTQAARAAEQALRAIKRAR